MISPIAIPKVLRQSAESFNKSLCVICECKTIDEGIYQVMTKIANSKQNWR